jgi:spermidine synthase
VMAEIDEVVVDMCREHLGIHGDYDDPRVTLMIGNALEYINKPETQANPFDVILIDINDPADDNDQVDTEHATAEALYSEEFYRMLKNTVLAPGGVVVAEAECPLFVPSPLSRVSVYLKNVFGNAQPYRYVQPFFWGGDHAFVISSESGDDLSVPQVPVTLTGKLYNADIHRSSFMLPTYWNLIIEHRGVGHTPRRGNETVFYPDDMSIDVECWRWGCGDPNAPGAIIGFNDDKYFAQIAKATQPPEMPAPKAEL